MAEKSGLGYFMAFDGSPEGEGSICLGPHHADAPEQADAAGRKTKSRPANKGKPTQRAVRPKQVRRSPKSPAKTEQKFSILPHEESKESFAHSAPAGTLARTKRLIMAALRVWELKQGIRE